MATTTTTAWTTVGVVSSAVVGLGPNGDFDEDRRTNLQEYLAGTDPTDADHDQDDLPDGWEWYWFGNYSHSGSELDAAEPDAAL